MSNYSELLKDPRWQRLRLEAMQDAGWKCAICHDSDNTLNVHHVRYRSGAKPWEHALHELQVLCEDCHRNRHDIKKSIDEAISRLSQDQLMIVLGYAQTLVTVNNHEVAIRVNGEFHASGIACAIGGIARVGDIFASNGGEEFVLKEAQANGGMVVPHDLHYKLVAWKEQKTAEYEEHKRINGIAR